MQRTTAAYYPLQHRLCMKHGKLCNNRVQWMFNRLQNSLLPPKYSYKFFRLICTCSTNEHQSIENPWDNVLSRHLIASVVFIDNYISQNINNAQASVLNEVMKHLRRHQIVPDEQNMTAMDPDVDKEEDCRTSAFKMFYLLKRAIEGDYSMIEPPKPTDQARALTEDKTLTFEMESLKHENIGHVIGDGGTKLVRFLRRYKCYVKFDKVPNGDSFKVQATIKKKAASIQFLEAIKEKLVKFAEDIQEEKEAEDEAIRQEDEKRREKFIEVLKQTEEMGPNAEWNTILSKLEGNKIYEDEISHVPYEKQSFWFEDAKNNWNQITGLQSNTNTDSTDPKELETDSDLDPPRDTNQPSSLDQAVFVPSVLNNIVARSLSEPGSPTKTPSESGISSASDALSPIARHIQTASVGINTMASETCTTLCIVHDRRWVPTFQYFLNQCYTQITMPRKYGYPLSKQICTCDKPNPDTSQYYPIRADLDKEYQYVKTKLGMWPAEQVAILQPLIRQLEKNNKAETHFSLVKLVFYFKAMCDRKYDQLDIGAKLPGDGQQCSFCSKPDCKANAKKNRSSSNQAGSGLSSSGSLQLSSLASGLRTSPPPSLVGGADNATQASQETAEKVEQLPFQPKIRTIRKMNASDWIDDCYFHGKKKKFVFQCIVNYLHHQAFLPVNLNIAFCMAVCCCGEDVVFEDYYRSTYDLMSDCIFMKSKLTVWRGDSKTSIQPYIELLDQYLNNKQISDGFMKFVCFFKKAFMRDFYVFSEIHEQMKRGKK